MYKVVVIGDIHIGKKFNTYKPNPFISGTEQTLSSLWTKYTIQYLTESLINKLEDSTLQPDMIVFLGDIFDKPSLRPEEIYLFTELLNKIQNVSNQTEIHIVVGNHDTTEPLTAHGTLLSIYNNYHNVYVHTKPELLDNGNLVMLPYVKREQLSDVLSELNVALTNIHNPAIFTHNDFYVNDTFIMTEMISVNMLKELLEKEQMYLFNGHIHNFYYESSEGIFFTGSVSPTSFKDSPMASGICYVEFDNKQVNRFVKFSNNKLIFITIDNANLIPELEKYLVKYREHNIKVVLRYPMNIEKQIQHVLMNYSDVILYYKYATADSSQVTSNTSDEETLQQVTEKLKVLVDENTLTKESLLELFRKFILDKYGIDCSKLESKVSIK